MLAALEIAGSRRARNKGLLGRDGRGFSDQFGDVPRSRLFGRLLRWLGGGLCRELLVKLLCGLLPRLYRSSASPLSDQLRVSVRRGLL